MIFQKNTNFQIIFTAIGRKLKAYSFFIPAISVQFCKSKGRERRLVPANRSDYELPIEPYLS